MCNYGVCSTILVHRYASVHYAGDIPPCAEEQLPVPGNSSVSCGKIENSLKCKITCHPMFKFGSSEDFSPQYCHGGVWDFQRDKIEIPDCQREHTHVFNAIGCLHTAYRMLVLPIIVSTYS